MTSNRGGRLMHQLGAGAAQHMVRDTYEQVSVHHERATTPFTTFQTRVVLATSGVTSLLRPRVEGDAAKVYHYMAAPPNAGISQNDVVWRGSERFRVVATEDRGHETQVILQRIQ